MYVVKFHFTSESDGYYHALAVAGFFFPKLS